LTQKLENPEMMNSQVTYSQSFIFIPAEQWEKEDIRARKIRIYPNKKQIQKMKNWIGTTRYVYNKTLNYVKTKGNKELNFYELRNKFVTAKIIMM
jgi:hypothetical protein